MANHLCKKIFLYDLEFSHNTQVTDRQTDGRRTTTRTNSSTVT